MIASTYFRVGGDAWSGISDAVALLPSRSLRVLATDVLRCLVALHRKGELDELATDRTISEATGWSIRSVQRALHALHRVLGGLGWAIIDRVRQHGRRVITFVRGVATRGSKPDSIAPRTPLPEEEKNTTTGEGSSSSLQSTPERPQEPISAADPALIERACRLIPGPDGADAGKVAAAVATSGYVASNGRPVTGQEAVAHALDRVERRNGRAARDGKFKVESWGFVLGILENRKREGWVPPDPIPASQAQTLPAVESKPLPHREPVQRMTADEVADLVAKCQSRDRMEARLSKAVLRGAVKQGQIGPELLATIPAEILEDPRAP